jgi:hypothetical protein
LRRIFIGSHSLPPLSGSPYRSFTSRWSDYGCSSNLGPCSSHMHLQTNWRSATCVRRRGRIGGWQRRSIDQEEEGGRGRGAEFDAPGFQPGSLILMIRSTVLTLVKLRSTWAITSKTSPAISNDTPWSTHSQGWVKTLVKPIEPLWTHQCQPVLLPRSPNFT